MTTIINSNTDPYFNLASEQYMLENCPETVFMLWRNSPAVIIGKNQNAYAEVNEEYLRENNISLVRRLTGGGAVFHDVGNVNFTYIMPCGEAESLDFARFTEPVINALRKIGLDASLSGRNDITANGKKVSGNAQCVYNGRVMHHGTLLYSADLTRVAGALNVNREKLQSKGIKSVSSRVGNIASLGSLDMTVTEFISYLATSLGGEARDFTAEEKRGIDELKQNRYSTWEWNWGRSGSYEKRNVKYFAFGLVEIHINADRGCITQIRIMGDFFGQRDISSIEEKLIGVCLKYDVLTSILRQNNINECIMGATPEDIAALILQ